ncbi:hypothetical protein BV25DRAFT_1843162 [Artomyces pyxidatus]|uniref:Uncharacterized protein n=1 Tax=Artomyces pyxidatus TaxID=48021 RepID=A0ACB8SGI0_9AGAM|nr:hypothetical protein BV25DRAFT_1843162 [Artomyces pyxidatus]
MTAIRDVLLSIVYGAVVRVAASLGRSGAFSGSPGFNPICNRRHLINPQIGQGQFWASGWYLCLPSLSAGHGVTIWMDAEVSTPYRGGCTPRACQESGSTWVTHGSEPWEYPQGSGPMCHKIRGKRVSEDLGQTFGKCQYPWVDLLITTDLAEFPHSTRVDAYHDHSTVSSYLFLFTFKIKITVAIETFRVRTCFTFELRCGAAVSPHPAGDQVNALDSKQDIMPLTEVLEVKGSITFNHFQVAV